MSYVDGLFFLKYELTHFIIWLVEAIYNNLTFPAAHIHLTNGGIYFLLDRNTCISIIFNVYHMLFLSVELDWLRELVDFVEK